MHSHHPDGSLVTVHDGWRHAARWGCDDVADEIARSARFTLRRKPVSSAVREFAADVASELGHGQSARWLNGMADTSGYGGGLRTELFDTFPELTTPQAPTGDGLDTEMYSHWFLVNDDGQPLKHRRLEGASPLTHTPT